MTGHSYSSAPRRRGALPSIVAALLALAALTGAPQARAQEQQGGGDVAPPPASSAGVEEASTPAAGAPSQHRRRPSRRRARSRARTTTVRSAAGYTAPRGASALASDLASMVNARTRSGRWGVMVVSLTRGDTLFAENADAMLQPASTMKLFTTALALDRLGPDWQFQTQVLRDGPVDATGTLQGNLYLRGDGDPAFSNRFLRGGPDAPVDLLARFVQGTGIRHVRGDLVADATAFDEQKIPDGWQTRYLGLGYAAPVSALSIDENVAIVSIAPGSPGGAAVVTTEPATSGVPLTNNVRTVRGSRGGSVSVRRMADGGIEARGWIGSLAGTRRYQLVIDAPARFTAGAFREALRAIGVTVDGQIRLGATPANATRVTALPSPPLARLVAVMNRESINHYAELLFRNAARGPAREGVGSAETGYAALRAFAQQKLGVDPGTIQVSDGSGLSVEDRFTPRTMIHLLSYANHAPWASVFHASLPVAGESELLRRRMKFTPAEGNLHAKTGTTNTVISLSGYVTAENGEVLAFAFMYNGTDRWNARSTIDRMGATLAGFVRE